MKNKFFSTIVFVLISAALIAQSPQKFQYQAVVRDASGTALVSQPVNFQISIISGSVTGTVVYTETHASSTNTLGVVDLNIGSGNPISGTFSTIDWGVASHFIKVEADPTGGTSYLDMGTTQLLSVPYALYSEKAGNIPTYTGGTGINVTGTTITNTAPDQTVTLSQGGSTTVSGTYPNFTISSTDLNTGTPGGLNKTVQYNNNGLFDGDTAAMVWDNANKRFGVGTSNPTGRVVIKGSPTAPDSIPLFEIKNKLGQHIMAVYNDSIHFYISDIGSNRGGFAVSGRNNSKALTNDYLRINADSTRVYTTDTLKGFGVKNIGATSKTSYMKLTPDNYLIGHESGRNITSAKYNSILGYKAGQNLTSGGANILIGYLAGQNLTTGPLNTYIGYQAGQNATTGDANVFVGWKAGVSVTTGLRSVLIGPLAGQYWQVGEGNVFVGYSAGAGIALGMSSQYNTYVGNGAGARMNWGNENVYMGDRVGVECRKGARNVLIGAQTNYNYDGLARNDTMWDNVYIGYAVAGSNYHGERNVMIGSGSNSINQSGGFSTIGNVFIGYQSGLNETGSNKLYIENSGNMTNPLIHGDFASDRIAFHRTATTYPLQVGTTTANGNGAYLTAGGVWTAGSSRSFKDRFIDINGKSVLEKIKSMELKGWYYKETQEYHIGPFAEDFYNAFGTGVLDVEEDLGKYLSATDVAGVGMVAIKELIEEIDELKFVNTELQRQIEELKVMMLKK